MSGFFTNMAWNWSGLTVLVSIFVWCLLSLNYCYAIQADIDCLKALKASLEDPLNILSTSWNFANSTEGFICRFIGIECWHPDENKVLNIRLSDLGLKGEFPLGLSSCTALTGVDLSRNYLSGNIPSNISHVLQFVTSLDLSNNNFSGEIPVNLSYCSYLNILRLDHNRLSGQIPAQLALLGRLKTFSVTYNGLSGPVPRFNNASNITAESYVGNAGLCGPPLPNCQVPQKKAHAGVLTYSKS